MEFHRLVANSRIGLHEGRPPHNVFSECDRKIQVKVDEVGFVVERIKVRLNLFGADDSPPLEARMIMSIGEPHVWQQNRRGCSSRFDTPMRQLVGSPQVSHSTVMFTFNSRVY